MIGKYRKMHLFDVDIPGGITMFESDVITPGSQPVVIRFQLKVFGSGWQALEHVTGYSAKVAVDRVLLDDLRYPLDRRLLGRSDLGCHLRTVHPLWPSASAAGRRRP